MSDDSSDQRQGRAADQYVFLIIEPEYDEGIIATTNRSVAVSHIRQLIAGLQLLFAEDRRKAEARGDPFMANDATKRAEHVEKVLEWLDTWPQKTDAELAVEPGQYGRSLQRGHGAQQLHIVKLLT